jgi:hypothetical protein
MASFLGTSMEAFPLPPLEAAGSTNKDTHPKAFVNSPQYHFVRFEWFVINQSLGLRDSSLSAIWALELCEAIFVAFVTLEGEASWMTRRHPRAPKVVVIHGKVCEGLLHLHK